MRSAIQGKPDTQGWLVIVDTRQNFYIPASGLGPDARKYDRIRFTFMRESFSETKSAAYSATQVLGRSEPIRGYLGSSPRTIQLQIEVPIEGDLPPVMAGFGQVNSFDPSTYVGANLPSTDFLSSGQLTSSVTQQTPVTYSDVFKRKLEVLDFIRSLVYPHYTTGTNGMIYPPPRVLVILGQWFSLLGIVTNWTMQHRGPWAPGDMTPYFTGVDITVEECDAPYSFQDVYGGVLQSGGWEHSQLNGVLDSSLIG